jgi:hypothetical protein
MDQYTKPFVEKHLRHLKDFPQTSKDYSRDYWKLLPKNLYKYRAVNRNNLAALRNDFVWMSTAESFNDPVDTTVNIDFNRVKSDMVRFLLGNVHILAYGAIKESAKLKGVMLDPSFTPDLVKQIAQNYFTKGGNIKSREFRLFLIENKISTIFQKTFEQQLRTIKNIDITTIKQKVEELLGLFITMNNDFQRMHLLYSLSSSHDNNAMWELYANHFRGYCIEYDMKTPLNDDELNKSVKFFPILYGKKKRVSARLFMDLAIAKMLDNTDINNQVNELEIQLGTQLLTKDEGWKGENEWRYILDKPLDGNKQKFPFIIKRIILGKNISSKDQQLLISIAQKKGITVYKQEMNATHSNIECNLVTN